MVYYTPLIAEVVLVVPNHLVVASVHALHPFFFLLAHRVVDNIPSAFERNKESEDDA